MNAPIDTTIKLRPGTLVGLSTSVRGGATYERRDLGTVQDGDTVISEWQTTKVVTDEQEVQRSLEVRTKARNAITTQCVWTPFWLICPEGGEEALAEGISAAKQMVEEFNATAVHTKVSVYVMTAELTHTEAESVAAIRAQVADLLIELEEATRLGKVEAIRKVCAKTKPMARLLEEGSPPQTALESAVAAARKVACEVVRRVQKQGEHMDAVLTRAQVAPVAMARFIFSEQGQAMAEQQAQPALPTVSTARFATLAAEQDGVA